MVLTKGMTVMHQMYYCPNCGAPVAHGNRFCGNCGQQLYVGHSTGVVPQQKNPPAEDTTTSMRTEILKLMADLLDKPAKHTTNSQ
jgi:hypothetical protein